MNRSAALTVLVLVALAFGGGSWSGTLFGRGSPGGATTPSLLVVKTSVLPSGTEVANPDRGSYLWQDTSPQPADWPVEDSYMRFLWRDLEPTEGHYDFSAIDRALAAAATHGGRLGLRIQAACSGCASPSIAVPDYLEARMPRGFWFVLNGANNYAPDWNDPDYLARLDALLAALGHRYDDDPRLGWLDISSYGDFGEWHVKGWPYPSPSGATPITTANAESIIRMNVAAFPHKRLLMQHQTVVSDGDDHVALLYALDHYPSVGIRNDCLGDPWFDADMGNLYDHYPLVANRWKTAPLMTELCGDGFASAGTQIASFHVANVANGNFGPLSEQSAPARAQFLQDNISSGYRFAPVEVTVPRSITRGTSFEVKVDWTNTGVTPAYDPWNVTLELRNPRTGRVVWSGISALDLRALLPTGNGRRTNVDRFSLGADIPAGTYSLVVVVFDRAHYLRPLGLAIAGRTADGAYPLATVSVR